MGFNDAPGTNKGTQDKVKDTLKLEDLEAQFGGNGKKKSSTEKPPVSPEEVAQKEKAKESKIAGIKVDIEGKFDPIKNLKVGDVISFEGENLKVIEIPVDKENGIYFLTSDKDNIEAGYKKETLMDTFFKNGAKVEQEDPETVKVREQVEKLKVGDVVSFEGESYKVTEIPTDKDENGVYYLINLTSGTGKVEGGYKKRTLMDLFLKNGTTITNYDRSQ